MVLMNVINHYKPCAIMWIKIFMLQMRMGANVFTCSRQRTKISRCTWWVSSFSRPPTSRETCNAWLYTSVLHSLTWHMNTYNPYKFRSTNRHILYSWYAEHFWNDGTDAGVHTMHKSNKTILRKHGSLDVSFLSCGPLQKRSAEGV